MREGGVEVRNISERKEGKDERVKTGILSICCGNMMEGIMKEWLILLNLCLKRGMMP